MKKEFKAIVSNGSVIIRHYSDPEFMFRDPIQDWEEQFGNLESFGDFLVKVEPYNGIEWVPLEQVELDKDQIIEGLKGAAISLS